MLKQTALIFGLGLSLALAGCAQTETGIPTPDQTIDQAKTESPDAQKRSDRPRPGQRGDGQRRTPPEASFAVCASAALGSACSVETPRGTREGVCRTFPNDDRAFCAPQRGEGGRGEGRRPRGGQ